MKKALLFSFLLFTVGSFAIEPKHFFQYLPITPFFPPERPSRDYLQLDGPYTPWKAIAPVPVWTEVALYRERVDEMRKLEPISPTRPEGPSIDGPMGPPVDTNIVIKVDVLQLGKPGQTTEESTIIDNDWFYIPKTTTSRPTAKPTPGSSSEFNKTPIPVTGDPTRPGYYPANPPVPTTPQSSVEHHQPDER